MKSKTTALLLSVLVGGLGIDRFYLGYTGMGILKLLTGGCLGILWIIDIAINAYAELEKVAKLHEQGILNDEEFQKIKSELLEKM